MAVEAMLKPFEVSVVAGETGVRTALADVLDGLRPLALDIEESGTVELVLAEALNNIVEHAYAEMEGMGPINIRCHHRGNGIHLRIEDHGTAMQDGQLPLGAAQDVEVDLVDLPEGGFGWFMIQDLAKTSRINGWTGSTVWTSDWR